MNVNDFVKHTKFGLGKVLELYGAKKEARAKIFFIGGDNIDKKNTGEKTIATHISSLALLDDEELESLYESSDFILLENINSENDNTMYQNINEAIVGFRKELNTEDFDGEFYLGDERNYKVHFHEHAKKLLNKELLKELLESKNHEQLLKNLKDVFSSYYEGNTQNLTHYLEPLKLHESLDNEAKIDSFFTSLYDVLYGENEFEERFKNWIDTLENIGHAKWTMVTIFLFIIHPDRHMYVKPETTKNALVISGFYTPYSSKPNFNYYDTVLRCSRYIFEKTKEAGLSPKDMIDVQSFMWCIRPSYTNDNRAYKKD